MKIIDARRGRNGLTWVEVLIAVVALVVLAALALPVLSGARTHALAGQMMYNMKQVHLATQQMALDGTSRKEKMLSWPGTNSYKSWVANVVPSYLSTNDFQRLMGVPGHEGMIAEVLRWWAGRPGLASVAVNTNAVLVYGAASESDGNAVFLSSANFLNTPEGGVWRSNVDLLSGRCFVVFHKAGDGAVLLPRQVGNTNQVGSFVPLLR